MIVRGGLVFLRSAVAAAAAIAGGFEAVAVAVQAQDADVVGQPVEQRAGEPLRPGACPTWRSCAPASRPTPRVPPVNVQLASLASYEDLLGSETIGEAT